MARKVFFSIHQQDVISGRANAVRNHWVSKFGRKETGYFDPAIWEKAKKVGDSAVMKLIDSEIEDSIATCVLVGSKTHARPWVRYEIVKSVIQGKHIFGVHINRIPDKDKKVQLNGPNPFDFLALRYSTNGRKVSILEFKDNKWMVFDKFPEFELKNTANSERWGESLKFSTLGCEVHCWATDKGESKFFDWVG
ncbi:MAG: TIR domain-containing protein [Xanthomonadaceae bacterium]|nr:TIR domain-containing protein [Xanthomonadaceae bacterium]